MAFNDFRDVAKHSNPDASILNPTGRRKPATAPGIGDRIAGAAEYALRGAAMPVIAARDVANKAVNGIAGIGNKVLGATTGFRLPSGSLDTGATDRNLREMRTIQGDILQDIGARPVAAAATPTAAPAARPAAAATVPPIGRTNPAQATRAPQARRARPIAAAAGIQTAALREETPAPAGPVPMIGENTAIAGKPFDAAAADITGQPGEFSQSFDGTNGGFGLTRNADGTVDQMFTLRQRTPEEDKLLDQREALRTQQNPVAAIGKDMSPGSQGAWEREQEIAAMLNRPGGLKTAEVVRSIDADRETAANNLRKSGIDQQNADAQTRHYGTEDLKTTAMLPLDIAGKQSDLLTADAGRTRTAAEIKKIGEETRLLPLEFAEKKAAATLKAAQEGSTDHKGLVKTYFDHIKDLALPQEYAGRHMELAKKFALAENPDVDYGIYYNPGTPERQGVGVQKSLFEPLLNKYRQAGYPPADAHAYAFRDLQAAGQQRGQRLYEDIPNIERLRKKDTKVPEAGVGFGV
jgi:hypothetical protein